MMFRILVAPVVANARGVGIKPAFNENRSHHLNANYENNVSFGDNHEDQTDPNLPTL